MVEKDVTLKMKADVDKTGVEDLEDTLERMQENTVTVPFNAETATLDEIENRIEELEQKRADIYMGIDDTPLEEVEEELAALEEKQIIMKAGVEQDGIDEAAQGLNDLEQSATSASSALEAMALIDIAGSLGTWGAQAESFAQELDNIAISTEQLAIQTGMTDSQMTGMLNNITNATFPRDEALMYVQSLDQIGVSSENLGASATGLDKINDAFHMGASSVNSLGQELSVLGVDMNNVSSAFNALAYANANTVGGMENFSRFLKRFDADFNQLGLNVDQAAVLISAATHKFGGGRAALTGMSTALKECNGDLSVLEQSMGLQAGSLSRASELTGEYSGQLEAMAEKEAQHKTLTQLIAAALDDLTASTMGVLAPFSSFIGMVGNAGSFAVGLNGIIQLANTIRGINIATLKAQFDALITTLTNVASAAWSAAGALASSLKEALVGVANAAKSAVVSVVNLGKEILIAGANALKAAAMWVVEKVQLIASTVAKYAAAAASTALAVAEWLAASPILVIAGLILVLIGALWYLYNTNETVRAAIDGFGQALISFGQALYGGIMGTIQWLIDGFTWLSNVITTLFNSTGVEGTNWLSTMLMVLSSPIGAIMFLIQNWNMIGPAVSSALSWMYNTAVSWFNQTISGAVSFGSSLVSTIGNAASNASNSFMSGISGLASAFMNELSSMLDYAINWASNLASAMYNAASNAVNSFLGALNIHSPGIMQTKFIGEMEGIVTAAQDAEYPLGSAMSNVGSNAVNNFDISGLNGNVGGASGGRVVNNEFNFVINGDVDSDERMKKFADYIIDLMNFENDTAGRTV